ATVLLQAVSQRARQLQQLGCTPEQLRAAIEAMVQAHRKPHGNVHPSYNVMTRSGRTSCTTPNIQQIPKDSTFRQSFVAPLGQYLLTVDYSFIELRTFAATALQRYGWSDMARVIMDGVDPHVHTGAMMLNVPLEEFQSWKDNNTVVEKKLVDGKEVEVKLK